MEGSIRHVAEKTGVTLSSIVDQPGFFDGSSIDRFFLKQEDLLSFLFKKYSIDNDGKRRLNAAQPFEVQVRSADAAVLRLSYQSFLKLAVDLGIYPEIDNSLGSNFCLMRIFLYATGMMPEEEKVAFERSGRFGVAEEEDEEEEEEDPMALQQNFMREPNLSFVASVPGALPGAPTNKRFNRPSRGGSKGRRKHRRSGMQKPQQYESPTFSEHLASQSVKLAAIFAANKAGAIHNNSHKEIRQVLNSIGENPLPGEFQLLMKLLQDAKATTSQPTLQRSKSTNKRQLKMQLAKDAIVTSDEFIDSWKEVATLARKTATLCINYDAFKVCISTCFFFMYISKFKKKKKSKRRSSMEARNSFRPSIESSTSELDRLVANAAALIEGDEPFDPSASFMQHTSIDDPLQAEATKDATGTFDELLWYAARDLAKLHQDVFPEPSRMIGDDASPQTPDEQLHSLQIEWEAMLVNVFRIYTRIWNTSTKNVLSKDAFLVYINDCNLFKKVPQSIVSNVIDEELDTEVEDCIDIENFIDANNLLLKENWAAKMKAQGANQEQLIWNNSVAFRETKAYYDRLRMLFDLYEMPSRAPNFQKGAMKAKVAETVTAEIGSTVSHSIHQHPTQSIDYWSGSTIKLNSVNGGSSGGSDNLGGETNFSNYNKRADVLALIVDRSVVQGGDEEGDGQEEKKTTSLEEEEEDSKDKEEGAKEDIKRMNETIKMSNMGKSILDMAMKLSVRGKETTKNEEIEATVKKDTKKDRKISLRPPPVKTAHEDPAKASGTEVGSSSAKANNSSGLKFGAPPQHDRSIHLQSSMSAKSSGKKSPGKTPKPPSFNAFRRTTESGNKKKHRKVFKKQFGLSRGIQPFQPRLTTNSRERKRTAKKMAEKCDLIMQETKKEVLWRLASTTQNSQQLDLTNDPHFLTMINGSNIDDERGNSDDAMAVSSHPSYKLFVEALKIRRSRPEQSIALCEKALIFSQTMQHAAGYEHRLNIYEEAVGTCLYLKKYEHAADLMEGQLELIRQSTTDRKDEVKVLNQLGKVHYMMENYDESETCHALQQNLAHSIFDHFGEMHAFYGQGMALYALRHLDEACDMFKKYLDNAEECDEDRDVAIACGRMGLTLLELGKLGESFASFKKQVAKLREILNATPGDNAVLSSLASAFGNLGKVYRKWGKLPLSHNAFNKQLKLAEDLGFGKMLRESLYDVASVNVEMKLGVKLDTIPKYVGFGGSEGDEVWLDHLWKESGWGKHWSLFRRMSGGDKFGSRSVGEGVLNESKEMLSRIAGWEGGDNEMIWKSLVDMGSLSYLLGDAEEGGGYFLKAKELLDEMALQKDEEGGGSSEEEEEGEEEGREGRGEGKKVDWDIVDYELKMKRIRALLTEGVYLMMMKRWSSASHLLSSVVGGDLTKNAIFMPFLAGGCLMYGWCFYKLRRKEEAEMWIGKGLKCFDIVRDGVGKAASILALVEVRVGTLGEQREWKKLTGDQLDMLIDLYGKCFSIGNTSSIPSLQVLSLSRLSDCHESLGDNEVATTLAKRAMKIRIATGDVSGTGWGQKVLTTKFGNNMVEKNALWSEVGFED